LGRRVLLPIEMVRHLAGGEPLVGGTVTDPYRCAIN